MWKDVYEVILYDNFDKCNVFPTEFIDKFSGVTISQR